MAHEHCDVDPEDPDSIKWGASDRLFTTGNYHGPGPPGAVKRFAFSIVNWVCMALLYRRAGRLTAQNGGFRPGQ